MLTRVLKEAMMETNVDRYAMQMMERVECWRGTDAQGNALDCAARSIEQAAWILSRKGVDVTTIHTIALRDASPETQDDCIEESRISYGSARAEGFKHYE